jgi:hypothetical protein
VFGNDATVAGSGTNLSLGSSGIVQARLGGTGVVCTLPALAANTSYFIALSGVSATGFNVAYTNLSTGQMFSQFVSSVSPTSLNGTLTVGNIGALDRFFNGSVAAAMYSNSFMSLAQLNQWAADPWSFWYPDRG